MAEAPAPCDAGTEDTPASWAQEELWYADQLVPGSPSHWLRHAFRVSGALDVAALRRAWQHVLDRHEILRTVIVAPGGEPVQRITPAHEDSWSFSDVQSAGQTRAGLPAMMRLSEGPLARLTVARSAPRVHVVVLLLHRAVSDDRSAGLVVDELSRCYAAVVAGRPAAEAPPAQYADYARWQRARSAQRRLDPQVSWWVSALSPAPPALRLPVDRARPAGPSPRGGSVPFDWGPDLGAGLARLSGEAGTTPATVVLAAFQALLARYSGATRVPVCVPAPVRTRPEFARLVGPCENLVVVCADLAGSPTFRQLAGRSGELLRAGLQRREVPFARVVRALNADRDPARTPLCDAMFRGEGAAEPVLRLPGTTTTREPGGDEWVAADLTLTVDRVAPSVAGHLRYRASIFDTESAAHVLQQLHTLLRAALAAPDVAVDRLPLETPAEIRAAVTAADRIDDAPRPGRAVTDLVHAAARAHPGALAVTGPDRGMSYRELESRAARLTDALRDAGEVAGRAVAVRMAAGPRQVAALLGVLDAGAHLVCLGGGDAGERGRAMLAEVRPACLVVDGDSGRDPLADWFRTVQGGHIVDIAALDHTPALNHTAALNHAAGLDHTAASDRLSAAGARTGPATRGLLRERAYVAYTSGSTGAPKGIVQSHATLAQFVTWFAGEFGITAGSRVAQWAAPGYDASLVEIFAALVAGATVCTVPARIRAHPEKVVEWLAAERITLFQTVPSFAREVAKVLRVPGAPRPATLDHVLLAGEALPGELATALRAALPGARLVNLYGATESILATWHEVTGEGPPTVPVGQPIPGRQVLVLDDRDEPCPAGVTGNLVVRSPYLTPGYLGTDAAAEPAFRPVTWLGEHGARDDRWYRTGDLGRRNWAGALEFQGRRDAQVKFRGIRLELADIEAALAAEAAVAECAVVAITDSEGLVEHLRAYVVARAPSGDGPAVTVEALRRRLRRRFGESALPVSIRLLPRLPRNLGGKVDRARLPGPDRDTAPVTAARWTPVERELAAIWSRLLPAGDLTLDDTFFAAGGHSLSLVRMVELLRRRFGIELSLWEYFENPTLGGLAALVETRAATAVEAPPR